MPISQSLFTGMDMDSSYTLRDGKKYFKLLNGSLVVDDALGTGTISNSDGNDRSFRVPSGVIANPSNKIMGTYAALTITNVGGGPGTANVTSIGGLTKLATWNTSEAQTATDFFTAHAAAYLAVGVTLTNPSSAVLRFTVEQGAGFTYPVITNATGNLDGTISAENSNNHIIIGAGTAGDYVVLFTTAITSQTPGGTGSENIGAIWAFKYSNTTNNVIGILADDYLDPTSHIIFYDRLNFATDNPISMISNAENDSIIKVYFTDGYNNLRQINILEADILDESLDHLEIIENVSFSQPLAYVVTGGVFYPGAVQYAFQMFSYGGSETKFSTTSPLINISAEDYDLSTSSGFLGSEYDKDGDTTGKAVHVTIPSLDYDFDYIRIVRIFYNTEYASPQIDIVAEIGISDGTEIEFVDNGDITLGSFTHQEFAAMGGVLFSAGDLATSNNRLIAGNITESFYNPDYDARVYRFDAAGPEAKVVSASNSANYYLIQPDGTWVGYGSFTGTNGTNFGIPTTFDSVNPDQDVYKYQSNGTTLGGTGLNASYKFVIKQLDIDNSSMLFYDGTNEEQDDSMMNHYSNQGTQSWESELGSEYIDNNGYLNYASEVNSAFLKGYRRDEKYRMGKVLFDIKGRASFVNWIGDIKMPKITDTTDEITYVDTSTGLPDAKYDFGITTCSITADSFQHTRANVLGLEISVSNPPAKAVSYQIVRVSLNDNDRTIVASGLITPTNILSHDSYTPGQATITNQGQNFGDGSLYYGSNCQASRFGQTVFGTKYSDNLVNFWSPEFSFYKNASILNGSLHITGKVQETHHNEIHTSDVPYALYYKAGHITPVTQQELELDTKVLITKRIEYERPISGVTQVDGSEEKTYEHFVCQHWDAETTGDNMHLYAHAGIGAILKTKTSVKTKLAATTPAFVQGTSVTDTAEMVYGTLKNANITQYNGDAISSRKTNKYIKTSALRNYGTDNPDIVTSASFLELAGVNTGNFVVPMTEGISGFTETQTPGATVGNITGSFFKQSTQNRTLHITGHVTNGLSNAAITYYIAVLSGTVTMEYFNTIATITSGDPTVGTYSDADGIMTVGDRSVAMDVAYKPFSEMQSPLTSDATSIAGAFFKQAVVGKTVSVTGTMDVTTTGTGTVQYDLIRISGTNTEEQVYSVLGSTAVSDNTFEVIINQSIILAAGESIILRRRAATGGGPMLVEEENTIISVSDSSAIAYDFYFDETINLLAGESIILEATSSSTYTTEDIELSITETLADTSLSDKINVFGGDTYITMFEGNRIYADVSSGTIETMNNLSNAEDKSMLSVITFPVETTVNVDWRSDKSFSRETGSRWLIQDEKGSHEIDGNILNQEIDAYVLNYTYIRDNNIILFEEEPTFFDQLSTNLTHRLMASESKYDGEMSDSWLKFKPNNILDVNGTSGSIRAIEAISENLYIFQDNSIMLTKIDERAMVNDTEGVSLVLGTGDIFGKPIEISATEGTTQQSSVIRGRDAIYFYDTINSNITMIGAGGVTDITRLKGIRSYIKGNTSSDLLNGASIAGGYGVFAGFNPNTSMVYFTFKNTAASEKTSFTIGYNEILKQFVSFYNFVASNYISDKSRFLTVDFTVRRNGWRHEAGTKGSYYGTVYDTVFTPIITDKSAVTKVFDAIEYTHDAGEVVGIPPSTGIEQVTEGSFSNGGAAWTADAGWLFPAGFATIDGSQVATQDLNQANILTSGDWYTITFDWTRTAGTLDFLTGGIHYQITGGASGTATLDFQASSSAIFRFTADADFAGTLTNISVKTMTDTFRYIRCYNNFLDTTSVALDPKFRFRTWRAKLPRYTESGKNKRLMGKYLKMDMTFDNTDNKELFLNELLTYWRPMVLIEN